MLMRQGDMFGHVPDDPGPMRRARATNRPLSRVRQSTAAGRRVADLFRSYLDGMIDRSCVAQADALRAAELVVAAEEARTKLFAGNGDANGVVRMENLAARAVRKLAAYQQQSAKQKRAGVPAFLQNKAAEGAR
jgi:hypothetical protein